LAEKQHKPKPPPKADLPPCRNCGKCDDCLGISAPEGMKICRQCGKTKPLIQFPRRADTGGYRNQCAECRHGGNMEPSSCEACGRRFWRYAGSGRMRCTKCQPGLTQLCGNCGTPFTRTRTRHSYCSQKCQIAARNQKRSEAAMVLREQLIKAYGGKCACPRCPETNQAFLTLEHVNGDGAEHRRTVGRGHAVADLRRRGWPQDGYTLLCWNCNLATRFGRTCPHMEPALVAVS
jgi:hypothetical protein